MLSKVSEFSSPSTRLRVSTNSSKDASASSKRLWRQYSDRVHGRVLRDWLGARHVERVLKTDLFDESLTDGLVPLLRSHADVVHGLDVSEDCVRAAMARHPDLTVWLADIRRLPFPDATFDSIVSNSTLDHFSVRTDIDVALAEMSRVLRPGGPLFVSSDNPQNPVVFLRNALPDAVRNRLPMVPYYVGKTLGRQGVTEALARVGCSVAEWRVFMHCPRVLAVPFIMVSCGFMNVQRGPHFPGIPCLTGASRGERFGFVDHFFRRAREELS